MQPVSTVPRRNEGGENDIWCEMRETRLDSSNEMNRLDEHRVRARQRFFLTELFTVEDKGGDSNG